MIRLGQTFQSLCYLHINEKASCGKIKDEELNSDIYERVKSERLEKL